MAREMFRSGAVMLAAVLSAAFPGFPQRKVIEPDLIQLLQGKGLKVSNRAVTAIEENGRKGLSMDERLGDGIAWIEDVTLADGVIECDLKGKDVFQRSFVGLAFRGVDEKTQDVVYCRPFNFRATDPDRRAHAVQYTSHPTYPWQKLRQEHPGVYEKPVTPVPDPNDWFHLRVVVTKPKISVYINDGKEPSLVVQELSDRTGGWVGLWVGNGSGGAFANLKVTQGK